jgi:4'-phosphopantetheinyl transferase EntD
LRRLPSGAPDWPPGVVGSIAHTTLASHAAVAWRKHWGGLGIDSEARLDLDSALALLSLCADSAEQALVWAMADVAWATTALFSAKEAFFKAAGSADARAFEFDAVRLLGFAAGADGAHQLHLRPAAFFQMGPCLASVITAGTWVHSAVLLPA